MPVEKKLSARAIAKRIREKIADLNDELVLAELAELDVEIAIGRKTDGVAAHLVVWCSQEV